MRILVTGGAGFIGSHVVDQLVEAGADVRVLDSLSPAAHASTPGYLNDRAEYLFEEVTDPAAVRRAVGGVDVVCHLAARVGLETGISDAPAYVSDNDMGTAVLLSELADSGFCGRLVLASSMVVYGEGAYRCRDHGHVRPRPRLVEDLRSGIFDARCPDCDELVEWTEIGEDFPLDPRNVYAATKLHQENLASVFGRQEGLPVVALRYHNVYGPRMPRDTPYAGVASIFASSLAAGESPHVFEDGRQVRDFIHVRDAARATVLAATSLAPHSGALNISSGTPHTISEMASALCAASGTGLEPLVTGGFRAGDVRHVVASPRRAEEVLGFEAEVAFEQGLAELASGELRGTVLGRAP